MFITSRILLIESHYGKCQETRPEKINRTVIHRVGGGAQAAGRNRLKSSAEFRSGAACHRHPAKFAVPHILIQMIPFHDLPPHVEVPGQTGLAKTPVVLKPSSTAWTKSPFTSAAGFRSPEKGFNMGQGGSWNPFILLSFKGQPQIQAIR
jgi:hypothetical protein